LVGLTRFIDRLHRLVVICPVTAPPGILSIALHWPGWTLAKAAPGLRLNEHLEHEDGEVVFRHACKTGLEGIVSKRKASPYRSGRSPDWLKSKNMRGSAARGGRGLGQGALVTGKHRIMIVGPKNHGAYVVAFRTAAGEIASSASNWKTRARDNQRRSMSRKSFVSAGAAP
jgi:bifunctional non-homologous end joining protein LigD